MRTAPPDTHVEYLLHYLADELRDVLSLPETRMHAVAPSTLQQSPDLPQDYDPDEKKVHTLKGVRVKVGSRDFFFSADWAKEGNFELVREHAEEVRNYCEQKRS